MIFHSVSFEKIRKGISTFGLYCTHGHGAVVGYDVDDVAVAGDAIREKCTLVIVKSI